MSLSDLESRRNRILEAVIDTYVSTAVPVGSELIAKKLRSTLSPATIRHVMGDLEGIGYLEQPHTSAGRVPTDRGYRYYVDSLMDVRWLLPEEQRRLVEHLDAQEADVEQLLEHTGVALAELTQQAAFVVAPTLQQGTVRQIELVPLSVRKILCVLVANHQDMFASHVVEVEEPITRDEATALVHFINTQLVGVPFDAMIASLERRLLAERDSFYHLVKRSLDILQHALSVEPHQRLIFEGASHVVAQPEFQRDPHKAHRLLQGLELQDQLVERVRQDLIADRVHARIGSEIQLTGYEECSYIAAPFLIDGTVAGAVGVLGPRRMDYPRLSAWVQGMARALTELLQGEAA